MEQDNETYLIDLARKNIAKGIIYEPRIFYDSLTIGGLNQIIEGTPDVFRNGEAFPMLITHMVASTGYLTDEETPTVADERQIQRIGLRLQFHDQFYMNAQASPSVPGAGVQGTFTPVANWGNVRNAAAQVVSAGTSALKPVKGWILSARDTLRVNVQRADPQVEEEFVPVTVSITGVGLESQRPYFWSGAVALETQNMQAILASNFQNNGSEPVYITDTTINVGGATDNPDPTGDSRRVFVGIQQVGNGTSARWVRGPLNGGVGAPMSMAPASLWGNHVGRAVVHRFPGQGLLWEPGEGLTIQAQSLNASAEHVRLQVALQGVIAVQ